VKRKAVNIKEKFTKFNDLWSPRIIAQVNNYQFKIARVKGDFTWHDHKETDEAFIVIDGELRIDFRDGSTTVRAGELLVVPKGIEHKPFAEKECRIMMVEPSGTVNTGDAGGDKTKLTEEWV